MLPENTAPVLQVPEAVYVTIHVVAAFVVTGVDPDVSDSLTYRLLDDANGILRIDQSTGEVSVNMTSLTPFKIE